MQDFRKLKVWEKAHQITVEIYAVTKSFPKDEMYGLTNQIRRSAASVPTNIAEGCGHSSGAEFRRYLDIAMASSSELDYQLLLAHDLGYLPGDRFHALSSNLAELRRMLSSFILKVRTEYRPPKLTTNN